MTLSASPRVGHRARSSRNSSISGPATGGNASGREATSQPRSAAASCAISTDIPTSEASAPPNDPTGASRSAVFFDDGWRRGSCGFVAIGPRPRLGRDGGALRGSAFAINRRISGVVKKALKRKDLAARLFGLVLSHLSGLLRSASTRFQAVRRWTATGCDRAGRGPPLRPASMPSCARRPKAGHRRTHHPTPASSAGARYAFSSTSAASRQRASPCNRHDPTVRRSLGENQTSD